MSTEQEFTDNTADEHAQWELSLDKALNAGLGHPLSVLECTCDCNDSLLVSANNYYEQPLLNLILLEESKEEGAVGRYVVGGVSLAREQVFEVYSAIENWLHVHSEESPIEEPQFEREDC